MRCVLFICLSVVLGLAAGYPQRPPQYDLPYNLPYPFHSPDQPRRHRDLVDESPETDSYGQRGFARPEFGLSDFDAPYSPFSDMMTQMQEMMVRLKQEMNEILRRLPANGSDGEGALIPVTGDGFDLSNAQNKTTSRTEVIDGQVYTINETVIRSGDDEVGSVIRVKTIRVVPTIHPTLGVDVDESTARDVSSSTEESAEVAPVTRNAKNNDNNEIPNNEKMPIPYRYAGSSSDQVEQHLNEIQSNTIDELDEDNSASRNLPGNPRSLSNDLAVNYIAASRKGGSIMMLPSDVELVGVVDPSQQISNPASSQQYYKYDFAVDDGQVPPLESVKESLERIEDVELRDEDLP